MLGTFFFFNLCPPSPTKKKKEKKAISLFCFLLTALNWQNSLKDN